ncbi:MAG: hypothetical protein IT341_10535 [Chloroflexi bacterium]|nr:hypothetical protein [Chloroflexota bacterium]
MAVVVLTVYERDDPPVAGGSATALGTIDRLISFEATSILSTHGFNAIDIRVNRHDDPSNLLQAGRWVTVTFPAIQTDPVDLTVRLGPSHTTVLSQNGEVNEIIHVGGLGILSLFQHARLLEVPSAPSPPASAERGSSNVPGRWQWRQQPPGAIMTRGVEEGQNHVGTPLSPIDWTATRTVDSDGNTWVSLAEDRFFEINTNADAWNLYQRLAQAGDMYLVERFDFQVDAYNGFGTTSFGIDRTSATFGAGKVRITAEADVFSNILTDLEEQGEDEPYTHVSVEGANATYVTVADPGYSSGPGRMAAIEYRDSDDPDMLERVGLEFLRRQHARTVAREVEITPGDDEANGRYLPWKHLVPGDLHTLDAGGIDEDVRLIGLRVELVPGAHDATTEDAHRSLRVVCEYNDASSEPGGDGGMGGEGAPGSGSEMCCGPRPPTTPAEGNSVRLYHTDHQSGEHDDMPEQLAAPDLGLGNIDAAWEDDNGAAFEYFMMDPEPQSSVNGSVSWSAVNAAVGDVAIRGYVVRLGHAGITSLIQSGGTVRGQNRANARNGTGISEGAQNHRLETCGRIYREGTGFVATLWNVGDCTGDVNLAAQPTHVNRSWGGSFTGYASADEDDYLVIEYGVLHTAPTGGGTGAAISFRDTAESDLPEDDVTTTSLNSWVELTGSGTVGDDPLTTVRQGQGDYGDPGTYVPTGSTVEAGLLSDDGEHYFNDSDIEVPDPTEIGLPSTVRDVRAALAAIVSGLGTGATVVDHGTMGATETFDFGDGSDHEGTLGANLTVSLDGASDGEAAWMTLKIIGDGSSTITWPESVIWPGDIAPDAPGSGEALVVSLFTYDGGTNVYGSYPGTPAEDTDDTGTAFTVDAGTPTYDDEDPDSVEVSITSKWGIDGDGLPYFNDAGVTSGEEAALMRDSENGTYFLRPYTFS